MLIFLGRVANQLFQGYLKPSTITKTKAGALSYDVSFRCWPMDLDAFMHMNNAMYVRVAELARWRIFVQSGTLSLTSLRGILFLAVEQHVQYLRPIRPLQRFVVRTAVSAREDKWVHYTHTFLAAAAGGAEEVLAVVKCKAVLKERDGRTVYVSSVAQQSPFYRQMLEEASGSSTASTTSNTSRVEEA
ncbi:acyl-CoA thioesterase [archaeon]|nr:MAG: acyl-CoA thioesterase [archaeon]